MSLKKTLKLSKMRAVRTLSDQFTESMMKKTLTLEKLFQLLSQKKHDTLLHINEMIDKKMSKKTDKKTDENKMKEDNKSEKLEF
ncbi:hypothetical protein EMPG_13560 [Blastomyces silverae]|uniref:Uncharacterized protein n=1 Tax=Blastomyces silverae TaxID=2060906 RepID=A0A0H1BIF5_9EURO|nr:hypothetical protein EMPG_13560 [Blastomyces silverae]